MEGRRKWGRVCEWLCVCLLHLIVLSYNGHSIRETVCGRWGFGLRISPNVHSFFFSLRFVMTSLVFVSNVSFVISFEEKYWLLCFMQCWEATHTCCTYTTHQVEYFKKAVGLDYIRNSLNIHCFNVFFSFFTILITCTGKTILYFNVKN